LFKPFHAYRDKELSGVFVRFSFLRFGDVARLLFLLLLLLLLLRFLLAASAVGARDLLVPKTLLLLLFMLCFAAVAVSADAAPFLRHQYLDGTGYLGFRAPCSLLLSDGWLLRLPAVTGGVCRTPAPQRKLMTAVLLDGASVVIAGESRHRLLLISV
jgi:hypothetical protein